jgi:hypothetical protein
MNDLINGLFELFGGLLLFINCWKIFKDKQISGIAITPTAFFTVWGYWNLYYYPSLNQTLSFIGGIVVVAANSIWVLLAIYYQRKGKDGREKADR